MTPIVTDTTTPTAVSAGMPAASGEGAVFAALMAGQVANDSGTETGPTPGNALPTARQQFAGVDTLPIIITPPDAYPDPEQVLQGVVPGLKPQAGPKPLPIILTPPMPTVETGEGEIQAPVAQASPKDEGGKTPPIPMPPVPMPPLQAKADATAVQTAETPPKDAESAAPDEAEVQAPIPGSTPKSQPPIATTLPPQPDVVQVQLPVPAKPKPAKPVAIPATAVLLARSSQAAPAAVPVVKGKKEEEKSAKDDKPDAKAAVPDAIPLPIVVAPPARPEPQRIALSADAPRAPLPLPTSASDARAAPALPGSDAPRTDAAQPAPAPATDAKPMPFSDLLTAQASAPAEPKIVYPLRTPAPDNQAPAKLTIADLARSSASDAMARAQAVQPEQTSALSALPAAGKAEAPLPDFGAPAAAPPPLPQVAPVMQVAQPRAPVTIAAPVPMPVDTSRADWIAKMVDRIDEMKIQGGRAAEIRLLPDALGTIDVRIEHRGDQMNVSFTADNPHARALLAEAAPKLAELAEARGLRLGHTGVDQGQSGDRRPAQDAPETRRAPRSAFADQDSESDSGSADAGRIA